MADTNDGGGNINPLPKTATTSRVVSIFGLQFDTTDPITYIIFWAILAVILLLIAYKNEGIALGLAFTVFLAIAFAHK